MVYLPTYPLMDYLPILINPWRNYLFTYLPKYPCKIMMMKSGHGVMWNLPRGLLKSYLGVYLGYELSKIKAIDTLQKGYM
jgi:hypothetical protein